MAHALQQMGVAAAVTVAVAVLIALTLLPAILGFAGKRVSGGKIKIRRDTAKATHGERWARFVARHRWPVLLAAGPGLPRRPLPIEILVIDNGPGAPQDIAEHLFEPFVSGKPEGQGLGLPLVEKLVREGKSEVEVVAADPLKELNATWAANPQAAVNFTKQVYHSFSRS